MLINTPQAMQQYVGAVMLRARHHGGNVTDAIMMLKLLVPEYSDHLWRSNRQGGKIGNVSWFRSRARGLDYYLSYNHANGGSIELKRNNCHGSIVARFTNSSTASEMIAAFENL